MKKVILSILMILAVINSGHSAENDWGKTGHRAVGEIAEEHLTKKAKKAVEDLLNGHGLAYVANYADDIKSDPEYREYSPWHYVNMAPDQAEYDKSLASEEGDLVQAIRKCIEVLKSKKATKEQKQFYLKMLVHFMGDLHQPLHVGHASDKGGNDIQLQWFNHGTNLHRLWDSEMIDFYQMSYTELAENADVLSKAQVKAIQKGSLLDWVYESRKLAEDVYNSVETGDHVGYKYMYEYMPVVLKQLQKGGIRLAEVLNEIYS
ncbi:S1/P1 Nuclease [Christiangramia fulva]|uniref:S1/P1 Nuclease n=1 Tax=Christiangramia fulva TaxID=2126553 RepID=A0A2R3ZB53_9FLAO|nr:S1/P1 nuclease [Christiangramia fulva]AVR47444.1 S1/P1 Nuclease [Christiangramia fulva]